MLAQPQPEQFLDTALNALSTDADWRAVLDALPVPIYTTDAEGAVTYWNRACVEFAGREPQLGQDRWCVTWHLYTTIGDRLPHDDCPMAQAIRSSAPSAMPSPSPSGPTAAASPSVPTRLRCSTMTARSPER